MSEPTAPQRSETDGFAIGSLVTALIGIPVVPLLLGYRARTRIREAGGWRTGDGLATAGIVLGWIQLIALALLAFIGLLYANDDRGGSSEGPGCPAAPGNYGTFHDAFDFILHKRESVSGGICIGGPRELVDLTQTHLAVSFVAIAAAVIISVPIGLWLGHIGKGEFVAVSVSNVGRAVPSLALLAFFVAFLGLGFVNIAVVLMLLAIPPLLTNTYVGVRQVDRETVDAARGIGMTETQIIRSVELPLALPTIFSGLNLSAVAVVATATIAPLGNVNTLGLPIITPQNYGLPGQIGAAIVVALITVALGAAISAAERAVTPRGLKVADHKPARRFSLPIPRRMETNE